MENPFPPPQKTKPCPECGDKRVLAKVAKGSELVKLNSYNILWGSKYTAVATALVCPSCGHVSFFVEDPSIFKKSP